MTQNTLAPIGASFPLPAAALVFTPVAEIKRTYVFQNGTVTIDFPVEMHVSPSNGHRVLDANGTSHYVPSGWLHCYWTVKDGTPAFVA